MKDGGEFTWKSGFNVSWSTFAFFYSLWFSQSEYWSGLPFPPPLYFFLILEVILNAILGCLKCLFRLFHMEYFNILGKIEAVWVKKMERHCRYLAIWKIQMQGCHVFASDSSLSGSVDKESACNAGEPGSIPGSGRSTGEGIGYPLQYSWASLVAQLVESHVGDRGSIPGLERSSGEGKGYPFQYSGLYSPWGPKELDTTEQL